MATTDDVADLVLGEAAAREGARRAPDPLRAARDALARDAREGWPAHLGPRWLESVLAPPGVQSSELLRGVRLPAPFAIPRPLGGASFARALGALGLALAGAAPTSVPFALAHPPRSSRAHRFALALAQLPATSSFQRRALGLGAAAADDQARTLARAALMHARIEATRLLLTDPWAPPDGAAFEERTARAFGAPLPAPLLGAWPLARADETARQEALFSALPLVRALVDRFDDDWFRNPRAAAHLRALITSPEHGDAPAVALPADQGHAPSSRSAAQGARAPQNDLAQAGRDLGRALEHAVA